MNSDGEAFGGVQKMGEGGEQLGTREQETEARRWMRDAMLRRREVARGCAEALLGILGRG